MSNNYLDIVKYVFTTRLAYISISACSNLLIPDHENDGFKSAGSIYQDFESERGIIWTVLGGLQHWDVQHYLHIAQFGYTYENNLAFFPVYPWLLSFFSTYFKLLLPTLNPMTLLLIVGVILNVLFFTKATMALYDLTLAVFKDEELAYITAIIFCMSPASIFFLAPYTESLFSFLVFRGLNGFAKHDFKRAAFWFCVATGVRSNGITYFIFFAHAYTYYFQELFDKKRLFSFLNFDLALNYVKSMIKAFVIICIPYVIFQFFGYFMFCVWKQHNFSSLVMSYADLYNLVTPFHSIHWCKETIPLNYFIIQKKYWNVGFLSYFTFKQIPNFLLAFPMTLIILYHGFRHLKQNYRYTFTVRPVYDCVPDLDSVNLPRNILPYVLHAVFLTIWAFFNINVQVVTRLLSSSSPLLYWIVAHHCYLLKRKSDSGIAFKPEDKSFFQECLDKIPFEGQKYPNLTTYLYKLYFLSYAVVGIILFSNGYPWT